MTFLSPESLEAAARGDIDVLCDLDSRGLLIGPDETLEDYVRRLRALQDNIAELDRELTEHDEVRLLDIPLTRDDAIPIATFAEALDQTSALYDFRIDWIPGFFTNTRMGILFAGCAMYSYEDFFAIFVIRKAFKTKDRWIIYSRTELIAHELCHIAHIGFRTVNFEEIFAYQTSESRFRRLFGGLLRTTADTYLLLGAVAFLLASQIINVVTRPPMEWQSFPMPLVFAITIGVAAWIAVRYLIVAGRFRRARRRLDAACRTGSVLPILFRCSEDEITQLSRLQDGGQIMDWVQSRTEASPRWQIIWRKYFNVEGSAAAV